MPSISQLSDFLITKILNFSPIIWNVLQFEATCKRFTVIVDKYLKTIKEIDLRYAEQNVWQDLMDQGVEKTLLTRLSGQLTEIKVNHLQFEDEWLMNNLANAHPQLFHPKFYDLIRIVRPDVRGGLYTFYKRLLIEENENYDVIRKHDDVKMYAVELNVGLVSLANTFKSLNIMEVNAIKEELSSIKKIVLNLDTAMLCEADVVLQLVELFTGLTTLIVDYDPAIVMDIYTARKFNEIVAKYPEVDFRFNLSDDDGAIPTKAMISFMKEIKASLNSVVFEREEEKLTAYYETEMAEFTKLEHAHFDCSDERSSKFWIRIGSKLPLKIKTLTIAQYRSDHFESLVAILERQGSRLSELNIYHASYSSDGQVDKLLQVIALKCLDLTELNIRLFQGDIAYPSHLGHFLRTFGRQLKNLNLSGILIPRHEVLEAILSGCRKLVTLSIRVAFDPDIDAVYTLLISTPKLDCATIDCDSFRIEYCNQTIRFDTKMEVTEQITHLF
ncbi:hypothetical protein HDE_00263 [Halotydeus destructor]|nr:hypothetical protein HDE_00263 [Halotydeus destructor]